MKKKNIINFIKSQKLISQQIGRCKFQNCFQMLYYNINSKPIHINDLMGYHQDPKFQYFVKNKSGEEMIIIPYFYR